MRLLPPCLALLAVAVGGCASSSSGFPSLTPRAAEAIDPRIPIADPGSIPRPADPALAVRLAQLVVDARTGDEQFRSAAGEAERLAAAAGPPQSESWIAAQQALSALGAARAGTTRALSDIDALAGERLRATGGIAPGDLAAIEQAARSVAAIDERQSDLLGALGDRLGS